jgi:signal transduction histidine kinase/ligand-binding sensor domain-containing protein
MQRPAIILAYLFFGVTSYSQQFPFVHYTPKDGLISNQIKDIYQDSKGRLYFTSINGLSIYDGSRFINYTSKNGLGFDIVNQVMEMGDDSIWIVTNTSVINCLVKGKMKTLHLDGPPLVIDRIVRDANNDLYAASEQGLFKFAKNGFVKLPFSSIKGEDKSRFTTFIHPFGNYLFIQRDYSLLPEQEQHALYLYDKTLRSTVAELKSIYALNIAPDGRIWVSTGKNIMSLDTTALKNGKIVLQDLPAAFDKIKNLAGYFIFFDRANNCWLGDQSSVLLKTEPTGKVTYFPAASGLTMFFINAIFLDRENITWIATNNAGLNKLVQSNFSLSENPFGFKSSQYDLAYNNNDDKLLLFSSRDSKIAIFNDEMKSSFLKVDKANEIEKIIKTRFGFFGSRGNKIYKMKLNNNSLYPEIILTDSIDNIYSAPIADNNGNVIVAGKYYLNAIVNGVTICRKPLNFFADPPALDSKGNIWTVTRAGELIMFTTHPEDPANYLQEKNVYSKELSDFSPRSIIIDKHDNIWIGTRSHGLHVFNIKKGPLMKMFTITTTNGLSDDFTSHLACDADNNIWASSALGLDKIMIKNGTPVVENITKQNTIYQSVFKVVIDKNNTAWGVLSNGLIKIVPETRQMVDYTPTLMVTMVKAGKDTVFNKSSFSHKQNNFSFYFSATSFLDEKQILYSYRLNGGSNKLWSEPSNNSTVSFIDLPAGEYTLNIKASFPADRYPAQTIGYKFSISPPWWQTWWFRSAVGLLIIGLLIMSVRFYYRRKLEKQMMVLERQQAIEKERTRIATDMHDDLGAGLSRIKFLSQTMNKKLHDENLKTEMEKITLFSDEMSEKMGEIIWALNEKNDTIADLIAFTRSYVVEYLSNHNIKCEAKTPFNLPSYFVPGEMRRNIFLSVKECLHNVVKHSEATKVGFIIELNGPMKIIIHDNGKGIDWNNRRAFSNGIQNISKRMNEINGEVSYSNEQGTKVSLTVPITL